MDVVFWVLLIVVLGYEGVALVNRRKTDTISEKFLGLRALWPPFGQFFADALMVWLVWHLVVDPAFFKFGASWVDLLVIAGAVVASSLLPGRKET